METLNRYQKAAMVKNKIARENSIKRYYENPVICKECNKVIEVREGEKVVNVKKRIFCSRTCSASHNNKKRENKIKEKVKRIIVKKPKLIRVKNKPEKIRSPKKSVKYNYLLEMTKKELYDRSGVYYKFRALVRRHAHYVFNLNNTEKKCKICGYDNYVEVCHIVSVSSYSDDSTIGMINDANNLIGLCPNHHWEFDNGLISIK